MASRLRQIDAGRFDLIDREPSPVFEDWTEDYLRTYSVGDPRATWKDRKWIPAWKAEGRRPLKRSWDGDLSSLTHLVPAFRGKRLDQITRGDVERFKAHRLASLDPRKHQPVAPGTVCNELNCLKAVFTKALGEGKALHNPVKGVALPKADNRRKRILSAEEWEKVRAGLPDHLKGPMTVALYTGARIGSILALRKADVRFKDGGTEIALRKTKSGQHQVLPAVGPAHDALWGAAKTAKGSGDLLFTRRGKPIRDYRTGWANALERAGVTDRPWVYDLRRTLGTRALEAGADLVTIKESMGHSSVAVTERYLHPAARRMREAAAGVVAAMSRVGPSSTGEQVGSAELACDTAVVVTSDD